MHAVESYAAPTSQAACVELLLAAGADPGASNNAGETAILLASQHGNADAVTALLAAGADPNSTGPRAHTALFRGIASGRLEVVEALLAAGADPDRLSTVTFEDVGFVMYMRPDGVDSDTVDRVVRRLGPALGLDPDLIDAAEGEGVLSADAPDFDLDDEIAEVTPLYVAAVLNDASAVEALLAAGADPSIGTDPTGHLPGDAAEALGYDEIAQIVRGAEAPE
jgi:ankyrin repeat protein